MPQLRILIADDDHHARDGLRAFLSAVLSCDIVGEATNGEEAIVQIARTQPDAVLLDLRMPVLDGVQATRIIKELWPEITVVALTLYPDWRSAALAAGADAFMSKGDAPEQVVQLLRRMQTGGHCHTDVALDPLTRMNNRQPPADASTSCA